LYNSNAQINITREIINAVREVEKTSKDRAYKLISSESRPSRLTETEIINALKN